MTTASRIPLAYQYDISLSSEDAIRLARSVRKGAYIFTADQQEFIRDSGSLPAAFAARVSKFDNLALRDRTNAETLATAMRAAGFTSAKPFSQVVGR